MPGSITGCTVARGRQATIETIAVFAEAITTSLSVEFDSAQYLS